MNDQKKKKKACDPLFHQETSSPTRGKNRGGNVSQRSHSPSERQEAHEHENDESKRAIARMQNRDFLLRNQGDRPLRPIHEQGREIFLAIVHVLEGGGRG